MPSLVRLLGEHADGVLQSRIEFLRTVHHQEMICAFYNDGVERCHMPPVGFKVDRPEVAVNRDRGNADCVKDSGRLPRDILGHHLFHGAHGHSGWCLRNRDAVFGKNDPGRDRLHL